jgi:hypothetical protein
MITRWERREVVHRGTVRRVVAGLGGYAIAAAGFAVIGVLAVLLEIQSPSFVQWTGIEVHGYTQGGITFYSYGGHDYSVDNEHASAADQRRTPTVVWLSRSDPTNTTRAYVDSTATRWLDFAFTMGWFIVALGLLGAGLVRQRRRMRWRVVHMGEFGSGISDELVRRLRAAQARRSPAGK